MSMKTDPAKTDLATVDRELNDLIACGKALEAFEQFYADDVVMEEGTSERHEGKNANRTRERQFFGSVKEVHAVELLSAATGENVSFSEWRFDLTFKGGTRVTFSQVARRRWENGKVKHERFYKAT